MQHTWKKLPPTGGPFPLTRPSPGAPPQLRVNLKTATLAVRPEEAVRLATAQAGGILYLAMRPVKPANGYALVPEILISCGGAAPQPASIQFTAPAPVSTPYYTGPVNTGTGVQPAGAFLHSIAVIRGNSVSAVQVK